MIILTRISICFIAEGLILSDLISLSEVLKLTFLVEFLHVSPLTVILRLQVCVPYVAAKS